MTFVLLLDFWSLWEFLNFVELGICTYLEEFANAGLAGRSIN